MAITFAAHSCAQLFPLMSDDEYAALKADIAAHGVREPMTMHDGMILDGRNRYRACQELGIQPPPPRTLGNGQSPTAFVVSANLHRRHLSQSQKACVANNVEKYLAKEAKQRQRKHGGTAPGRKKTVPARLPEVISNGEARRRHDSTLKPLLQEMGAIGKRQGKACQVVEAT